MEIAIPLNPKNAYKQSPDKIIAFENEADLFNTCQKTYKLNEYTLSTVKSCQLTKKNICLGIRQLQMNVNETLLLN